MAQAEDDSIGIELGDMARRNDQVRIARSAIQRAFPMASAAQNALTDVAERLVDAGITGPESVVLSKIQSIQRNWTQGYRSLPPLQALSIYLLAAKGYAGGA
jgi:hypothetical protein